MSKPSTSLLPADDTTGAPLQPSSLAPLVAVWRGDRVESLHLGAVAVVDARGALVAQAGNPELTTYLRSSAKPFQLLPLVECDAADHFGFSDAELAVMAASHSGRREHVDAVRGILDRIGLPASALQCGAHAPYDDEARSMLRNNGTNPSELHNNCSGKHAGMLAWCRFNGEPIENYLDPAHPLQRRIRATLADLGGVPEARIGVAIDGCSAPCFAMPLAASAHAFARLSGSASSSDARTAALARIAHAMACHPVMVAGPGRLDTAIMQATRGRVVCKAGAEGYQGMALRDFGLGVAFKIADGQGNRASGPVAIDVLSQLGALDTLDDDAVAGLETFHIPELINRRGVCVGHTRPVVKLDLTR
jgi:L-asparaginase II